MALVVTCLCRHKNQVATKHVESSLVPRLDEGSSPSSSTYKRLIFNGLRKSGVTFWLCLMRHNSLRRRQSDTGVQENEISAYIAPQTRLSAQSLAGHSLCKNHCKYSGNIRVDIFV